MKFLCDHEKECHYNSGLLKDLFLEELKIRNYQNIENDEKDYVDMTLSSQLVVINNSHLFLGCVDYFFSIGNLLLIKTSTLSDKKIHHIKLSDKDLMKKIKENLKICVDSKKEALIKFNASKQDISEYSKYYLEFKFENKYIHTKYHDLYSKWTQDMFSKNMNLVKRGNDLFLVIEKEKILIPDVECRELKKSNLNNVYLSSICLHPLEDKYITEGRIRLLIKNN